MGVIVDMEEEGAYHVDDCDGDLYADRATGRYQLVRYSSHCM